MKHTPGPWVHGFVKSGWGVTPKPSIQHRCLLFVQNNDDGNILPTPEDAQLISAAPEMLKALQAFVKSHGRIEGRAEAFDLAFAAIAKAEGKAS